MAEGPVATIIIAAYNAQDTILRALRSASAQSVPVEIIVVDDCSGDDTFRIAEDFAATDPRLQVHRQPQNTGPAGARNLGLAHSGAPWVTILDSDDHMAPDRVERLLAQSEGADLVADDIYRVTDADLHATGNRLWGKGPIGRQEIGFTAFVAANRRGRHGERGELGFVKPLIRRAFLAEHNLSYDPDLRLAEDYLLYARAIAEGGRFVLVDPCGYFAVYRPDSLSSQHSTKDLGSIVAADRALATHPGLTRSDRAALRRHRIDAHKEWAWRGMIDAVHNREFGTIPRLFAAPPAVGASLVGKLSQQVWLRGFKALRR